MRYFIKVKDYLQKCGPVTVSKGRSKILQQTGDPSQAFVPVHVTHWPDPFTGRGLSSRNNSWSQHSYLTLYCLSLPETQTNKELKYTQPTCQVRTGTPSPGLIVQRLRELNKRYLACFCGRMSLLLFYLYREIIVTWYPKSWSWFNAPWITDMD